MRYHSSPSMHMCTLWGNKSKKLGEGKVILNYLGFSGLASSLKVKFRGRRGMNTLR